MDCRSCGVVNAPGRRYCRECGGRLGQACPACHFFNAAEDKHCGGCGRRLKAAPGPAAAAGAPDAAFSPTLDGAGPFAPLEGGLPPVPSVTTVASVASVDAGIGGQGVSQSEIDGLFENILDEEPGEEGAGA